MAERFTNLEQYSPVLGAPWWKAAGIRAGRTAILVAITYLPATYTQAVPWTVLLSAAVVAGVLSLVTSLAGLAEVNNVQVPWPVAILQRVVKTVAQALIGGVLANVVFIQDINWGAVLATTTSSGIGSLLLGILKTLPETTDPIAVATVPATVVNSVTGEKVSAVVPTVAQVSQGNATQDAVDATVRVEEPTANG